jgi:hypothetical protein
MGHLAIYKLVCQLDSKLAGDYTWHQHLLSDESELSKSDVDAFHGLEVICKWPEQCKSKWKKVSYSYRTERAILHGSCEKHLGHQTT